MKRHALHILSFILPPVSLGIGYLVAENVPLLTIEASLFLLILLLAGLLLERASTVIGAPFAGWLVLWGFLLGLNCGFFADLYFTMRSAYHIPAIIAISLYGATLASVIYLGYATRNRSAAFFQTLSIVFFLLTCSTIFTRPSHATFTETVGNTRTPASASNNGNIFIFILDAHIGLEGLPEISNLTEGYREHLVQQLTSKGFAVFGNAYSNEMFTNYSIPGILNATIQTEQQAEDFEPEMRSAALLETLSEKGYNLHIYQTNYIDICGAVSSGVVAKCVTADFRQHGLLWLVPVPAMHRVGLLLRDFLLAFNNRNLKKKIAAVTHLTTAPYLFGPLTTGYMLDTVVRDAVDHPRNTAFLIHLFAPHDAYMLKKDCTLAAREDWQVQEYEDDSRIAIKERAYTEQLMCIQSRIFAVLQKLEQAQILADSTVVLFGDHGSRIRLQAEEHYSRRQTKNIYSALLAVKQGSLTIDGMDLSPHYSLDFVSVADTINQLFRIRPLSATERKEKFSTVYRRTKRIGQYQNLVQAPE